MNAWKSKIIGLITCFIHDINSLYCVVCCINPSELNINLLWIKRIHYLKPHYIQLLLNKILGK
jgi:hypothetical protein